MQPVKTLSQLLRERNQRNNMNSKNDMVRMEAEFEFRTEKLAEAFEELDAKVQHLEARLDSLILILQRSEVQEASSSSKDLEPSS